MQSGTRIPDTEKCTSTSVTIQQQRALIITDPAADKGERLLSLFYSEEKKTGHTKASHTHTNITIEVNLKRIDFCSRGTKHIQHAIPPTATGVCLDHNVQQRHMYGEDPFQ